MKTVFVFAVFLALSPIANANPFADTEWSANNPGCKSGKSPYPRTSNIVWVQRFMADGNYRLYENGFYVPAGGNAPAFQCDNILWGSYRVLANNKVEITTDFSKDTKMCELDPYGTWVWDYEFTADGGLVLSREMKKGDGPCAEGDYYQFKFRNLAKPN